MFERVNKIMPYIFPVIFALLIVYYYFVDPSTSGFPIRCLWHDITNTQCPACGFQRATHSLLHGKILEALRYNYFHVISFPYAFLAILAQWYNYQHELDKIASFLYHRYTLMAYIIVYILWWITRNIFDV